MSATTTPKTRPIRFSDEMIKAIIAGNKTQTRRFLKQQEYIPHLREYVLTADVDQSPYGVPGDNLWVRESYLKRGDHYIYRATDETIARWNNSMFMPRIASRITLVIEKIRLERLQDITIADAVAEGLDNKQPVTAYSELWDTINAKKPERHWDKNPYVWVIEFKVLEIKS